jgi:glycosyltransferase involved in cell wall biosynthesis
MRPHIAYDISNYAARLFTATPTGIGRIDMAYGQHLAHQPGVLAAGVRLGLLGPRLHAPVAVRRHIDAVLGRWHEGDPQGPDADFTAISEWLHGRRPSLRRLTSARPPIRHAGLSSKSLEVWARNDRRLRVPEGAVYLNVAFASLHKPQLFNWLDARPDIKPVFVVHDLLPIDYPEYFWPRHDLRIRKAFATILRRAKAVIVSSSAVRERFALLAAEAGRKDIQIHVAAFPPGPEFRRREEPVDLLDAAPYFVICSTIEPRKNHLLLLQIWREMALGGKPVPKLLIVGKRGWENEQVIDLLERCDALRGHVLEVSNLSSPTLNRLVAHARGLLMPSFMEGFGLPLIEALALGTPVVASDIPVFREVTQGCGAFHHPLDGLGWKNEIERLAFDDAYWRESRTLAAQFSPRSWDDYFAGLDAFLATL